eukprot:546993-Rhodomonas_salina.2
MQGHLAALQVDSAPEAGSSCDGQYSASELEHYSGSDRSQLPASRWASGKPQEVSHRARARSTDCR